MKTCTKCGEEKPATAEFFHKAGKYLRNSCKECKSKYDKKFHETYERCRTEYDRKYYEDNKERKDEYMRRWRKDNREKVNAYTAKRYAIRKGATVGENFSRQDVLDEWGTDCHICTDPIDLSQWDQDHVIPLQPKEGEPGPHILDNVKPSHPHCNRSKGNKTPCKPF